MAEVEEPQFTSLKDRINALNQQKAAVTTTFGKRPPPPLPKPSSNTAASRPAAPTRVQTVNNPPIPTYGSAVDKGDSNLPTGKLEVLPPPVVDRDLRAPARGQAPAVPARGAPPPLPGRKASQPSLPPRNGSVAEERRGSTASTISYVSTSNLSLTRTKTGGSSTSVSSADTSGRKLPPMLGDAKLPPLPPSRREREKEEAERESKAPLVSTKSAPIVPQRPVAAERESAPRLPSRPQLPSRPSNTRQAVEEEEPALPPRRLPPTTVARNALSLGFNNKPKPPPNDTRPTSTPSASSTPPPIPLASKPSSLAIQASKNRPPPPPPTECLRCRDFSRPDQLASLHPRETLPPHHDITAYLASVLCAPFPSLTDKARAIFTWCHHNIAYDCYSFFNKCVKHHEPADIVSSGMAVCAGYAGVYSAIALKAGLECVVVNGHGKGFGHVALKPHEPMPPFEMNHAWNAVRIDGGEWKLLDACWGAGNVSDAQVFTKAFKPNQFTMSNEDFGLHHFPEDNRHFYRKDYSIPTWEEYFAGPGGRDAGEPVMVCSNVSEEHGFSPSSFSPEAKNINMSAHRPNDVIRFQFANICEHWDPLKHGKKMKPYLVVLKIGGQDGRKTDFVPFESNGYWSWVDVRVKDLGCRGGEVGSMTVETWDGQNGRGLTRERFLGKRNVGMSFGGVAFWKLV